MLSANQQDKLFRDIYSRKVTPRKLPENLYLDIAKDLQKGLFKGYSDTIKIEIKAALTQGPAFELLKALANNIFFFSAAKVFQQTTEMSALIVDPVTGIIRSFSEFKKLSEPVYQRYNEAWQRTEFDTTVVQAQTASQWGRIQDDKDALPMLRYHKNTKRHAKWDGITLPVDDPFWNAHLPPNGFNCACRVSQQEKGDFPKSSLKGVELNDDPLFSNNPAKIEQIFKERGDGKHPYFVVAKGDEAFKNRNFGLPLPKK